MVVVKGSKTSVTGNEISCACNTGDELSNDFEKGGIVGQSGDDILLAVCEGKPEDLWSVWSSALKTAASREV